jgi:3-oxoacyl-[acyl-carrier protein] reductase
MYRVALITGGARGIGRKLAESLARDGVAVGVCYRSRTEGAEAAGQLRGFGVPAFSVQADVSRPDEVAGLLRRVEEELGPPDILVHAAGPYHRVPLLEETVEGWNDMFASNLHSLFYLLREAAPGMIQRGRGGRVLAFSMANADRMVAQTEVTAHYLAKVGVLGLVRSYAKLLAKHRITVNAISPGFIDSGSAPAEELEKMKKTIPVGAIGTMDDVVSVARFLLSDAAAYTTGTNVHVSGGWGI